ncbi:hypothetical protein EDD15DRAFT_2368732 [Pisolithus albus]|nr:hypothetical protein EDD15DRAFT_2368732 [Pisolithus albus]
MSTNSVQDSRSEQGIGVFLYNFFEDSAATFPQWHTVLKAHSDRDIALLREIGRSPRSVLCTELKNLYVGVTRARKKLYLLDHSQKSGPMRELWSKMGLIDVAPPGTNICQYAAKSTRQQWAAAGHKLFNACQFQEAIRSFERADLPKQRRIAQAYGLYEAAKSTVQTGERQRGFLDAAEVFVQCAGETLGMEKKGLFREAAECYASADKAKMAAEFYIAAGDFTRAAEQYHKAGCFDEIVQILDRHPEEIAKRYRNKLFYECVVYYFRSGLRPPIPLFPSVDSELAYLKSEGLNEARVDLLESLGRLLEAAENSDALQRAVCLALDSLWRECSFDQPVQAILQDKRSDAYKVLNYIQGIPLERLEISDRRQIRFFRVVQQSPFAEEVYQLGEEFCNRGAEAMALMAFNVLSSQLAALHSADAAAFDNFLRRFERYVHLLISIVSDEIPLRATDPKVMKVFGIVSSPHHSYSVIPETFLHRELKQNRYLPTEINNLLKDQLQAHLRKKFLEEIDAPRISRAFSIHCPYSIMHDRHCGRQQCNQQHERALYPNGASYNMIINVHLQQIRISDLSFSVVGSHGDRLARMTAALDHLYEAIYCPIFVQGSIADLDWNSIRNAAECIRVVREWIKKTIEYLRPTGQPPNYTNYLMSVIRVTSLHTAFGGVCPLQEYVSLPGRRVTYGGQPFTVAGDNVSADIVACLTGSNAIRGLPALRFLLQNGGRMDLLVVCNFAEEVCSTLVSSLRPSGNSSPLHGLLVPRGWIMNPNKPLVDRDTIQDFLRCLSRLVNILRSGRAHTRFHLQQHDKPLVDIMLARMCRMLCILGYNVRDVGLSKIIAEILLLPTLEEDDPDILSVQTLWWLVDLGRQCLETILALDDDSAIQDLVHLVHKNGCYPALPISSRIPQLVFEDVADIARKMNRAPAL